MQVPASFESDGIPPDEDYNAAYIRHPEFSAQEGIFRPIARDGASNLEVMLRLQKALASLAFVASPAARELALSHSLQAFERAELALAYGRDLEILREECVFKKRL